MTTSTTRREAFESVQPRRPTLKARILAYLAEHPCSTVEAISTGTNLARLTVGARVHELAAAGLIGEDGTRPTKSGCRAAAWVVAGGGFVTQTRKKQSRAQLLAEVTSLRAQLDSHQKCWARLPGEELELLVSARAVEVGT